MGRAERHLFRYFLDGSFRSYFLGTALENERESPVHYAQISVCVLRREDDGSVRREALELDDTLLAGDQRLWEAVWSKLKTLASECAIKLVDLTEQDIVSGVLSDFDLRNKAAGKVRFAMHNLEAGSIGVQPSASR